MLLAFALVGCGLRSPPPSPEGDPRLHAILLNGGSSPTANYSSHLEHLQLTHEVLLERGFDPASIGVFDSDGGGRGLDQAWYREVEDEVLLIGTPWEDLLTRLPLRDSTWEGVQRRPATKAALGTWLESSRLESGDLLLFYVTDHGTAGSINLWREELSVDELRGLLELLPEGVQVVFAMNQCFSGSFQGALPEGACALYSVPGDRVAHGCYPAELGERLGQAYALAEVLRWSPDLAASRDALALTDLSPDVPLLSSDILLAEILPRDLLRGQPLPAAGPFRTLESRFELVPLSSASQLFDHLERQAAEIEAAEHTLMAWLELLEQANADNASRVEAPAGMGPDEHERATAVVAALRAQAEADGHLELLRALERRLDASLESFLARSTEEAVRQRQLVELRRAAAPELLGGAEEERLEAFTRCESAALGQPPAQASLELPPLRYVGPPVGPPDSQGPSLVGAVVTGSPAGTPVAALGLREGDVLLSVDGQTEVLWMDLALRLGPEVVEIQREEERLTLSR